MASQVSRIFSHTCLVTMAVTGTAFAAEYVVRPGETLSEIAQKVISGPVWGMNGSLSQILALNPAIKSPSLIYPNQVIETPNSQGLAHKESHSDEEEVSLIKPNPTRQIASEEVSTAEPFKRHTFLSLAPVFEFSRLDSTDRATAAKGAFSSDLNLGLNFAYAQVWSPSFQTDLNLSAKSVRFETSDSVATLNHSSLFLGAIDFDSRLGESDHVQFLAHLGVEQMPFSRSLSPTELTFDTASIPHVGIGTSLPLANLDPLNLNFELAADYLAPGQGGTSYSINSGYEVGGKLKLVELEEPNSAKSLTAQLYFNYFKQDTSITTQTYKELGAEVVFSFDYFNRSKGEKK